MIVDIVYGDVLKTSCNHIAFAVRTKGYNNGGFEGQVSSRFWSDLTYFPDEKALGSVLSKKVEEKTFHALICYEFKSGQKGGWDMTPQVVTQCLDSLDIPPDETVAVVLMGAGLVGQTMGTDVLAILGGLARSKKKVVIYTLEPLTLHSSI